MGLQRIGLANAARPDHPIEVEAAVDPSVAHLCLPSDLAVRLGLRLADTRVVSGADGRMVRAPYAGPLNVEALGRTTCTGGVVIGDAVVLGRIALDGMDVIVDPATSALAAYPVNPIIPGALAVGVRTTHP